MSRGILQSIPTWMVSLALLLSATTNVNQQLFHSFMLSLGLALYSLELDNSCRLPDACKLCVCVCVCVRSLVWICTLMHMPGIWMYVSVCVCFYGRVRKSGQHEREAQQLFIYMGRTSRSSLQSVLQRFVRRSHALPLQKREIAQEICFCVIKTNNAVVKW